MIELRGIDYRDDDYDSCGSTAHAVLEIGGMKILLCSDCLEELIETVHEFENTIFCHQCKSYIPSELGFNYSGRCSLDDKERDRDFMDTYDRPDKERISSYKR